MRIQWRITGPDFSAGIETDESGIVVQAGAGMEWAMGKSRDELREYFRKNGYSAAKLSASPPAPMAIPRKSPPAEPERRGVPWNAITKGYEAPPGALCWCGHLAAVRCDGCAGHHCQRHRWLHSHTSESMQQREREAMQRMKVERAR